MVGIWAANRRWADDDFRRWLSPKMQRKLRDLGVLRRYMNVTYLVSFGFMCWSRIMVCEDKGGWGGSKRNWNSRGLRWSLGRKGESSQVRVRKPARARIRRIWKCLEQQRTNAHLVSSTRRVVQEGSWISIGSRRENIQSEPAKSIKKIELTVEPWQTHESIRTMTRINSFYGRYYTWGTSN